MAGDERGASRERRGVAFALLVLATFLAIFYAQERKRETPLLDAAWPAVVRFRPVGGAASQPHLAREAHFKLRTSVGDALDVSIVSERSGRTVRVIDGVPVHAYRHRLADLGRPHRRRRARAARHLPRPRALPALRHTVTPLLRLVLEGPAR